MRKRKATCQPACAGSTHAHTWRVCRKVDELQPHTLQLSKGCDLVLGECQNLDYLSNHPDKTSHAARYTVVQHQANQLTQCRNRWTLTRDVTAMWRPLQEQKQIKMTRRSAEMQMHELAKTVCGQTPRSKDTTGTHLTRTCTYYSEKITHEHSVIHDRMPITS